jgi:hypothetical protein
MSVIRVAALAVGALLVLGGCQIGSGDSVGSSSSQQSSQSSSGGRTSSSVSCRNDVCRVAVAGNLSGTRLGVLGTSMRIESIEQDAVTLTVGQERARITTGAPADVAGLSVTVVSAGDGAAELEVRRT